MSSESKVTFFKQSGWLVIATGASGLFLMAVYPLVSNLKDFAIYASLLRVFTVLGIATTGLQIVMAQDAAAAVTSEAKAELRANVRGVAAGIFALWLLIAVVCGIFQDEIARELQITDQRALWVTMGLVLAQMFLPFSQGLLQGMQNFAWLGWSIMLNGLGRIVGIAVAVLFFKSQATGALAGALFGLGSAVAVALWPARGLFRSADANFEWKSWLKRVLPLTAGVGSVLFVMNADMIFVQRHFPREVSAFYGAVVMIGVGLVTITTPMAAVMFPKVVSSLARAQRTDSFRMALLGTAALGLFGAITCTIFPSLPLRIIFFNNPTFWVSAQLVPWFMWAMLPVTVANVLIADLLAKRCFAVSFWLLMIPIGYAIAVEQYLTFVPKEDYFAAFKGVVLRLGMFSLMLLAVSAFYSWRIRTKNRASRSSSP